MKSVASKSSVSVARLSRRRMRGVEHLEAARVERALDHLGRKARTAHPEQDEGVDDPGRGQILDELEQVAHAAAHAHRLVQPAEPLRLVVAGPERRVAGPDALDHLCGGDGAHCTDWRNGSTSSSNSRGRSRLGTCAVSAIDAR